MQPDKSKQNTIKEWYVQYSPMVLRRCRKMLHNEDQARDALQEVFVKMMRLHDLGQVENAAKYLFRTATYVCIDFLRAQKYRRCENDEMLARIACYDDGEKRALSGLLLEKIFRSQKPNAQEIAIMVYLDEMTYSEVAEALGISLSTVKNRLHEMQRCLFTSQLGRES